LPGSRGGKKKKKENFAAQKKEKGPEKKDGSANLASIWKEITLIRGGSQLKKGKIQTKKFGPNFSRGREKVKLKR